MAYKFTYMIKHCVSVEGKQAAKRHKDFVGVNT